MPSCSVDFILNRSLRVVSLVVTILTQINLALVNFSYTIIVLSILISQFFWGAKVSERFSWGKKSFFFNFDRFNGYSHDPCQSKLYNYFQYRLYRCMPEHISVTMRQNIGIGQLLMIAWPFLEDHPKKIQVESVHESVLDFDI